ncbi:MAG TPA: G1 family glutamic endopeptidase [Chloroflexota bacterium]
MRGLCASLAAASALLLGPLSAAAQALPPTVQPTANWAGYVATNAYYTRVTALIEAPTPDALQRLGTAFSWVGIGGAQSNDLIQAGLAEVNIGQLFTYNAWFEMLPNPPLAVPVSIQPQAWVLVDIRELAYNLWQISIVNGTSVFSRQFKYASSHSSAEWVVEAPAIVSGQNVTGFLPLAGVTGANFANMAAVANGANALPAQLFPQPQAIASVLGIKGVPTALGPDGASFSVITAPG